uniref:PTS sugar transporter subunit IIB n=1 Tax=Aeromonas veronii TaxID=654 RepID=UPI003D233206
HGYRVSFPGEWLWYSEGVALLGSVIYMQPELQAKAAVHGVKVQPIDMMDYGMQRGDKVLDYALSLIG